MSSYLFEEFDEVSAKQWKQKIQFDLKGADYNNTLISQTLEGININPFYHKDQEQTKPLTIPFHPKTWSIAQHIFIDSEKIANKIAKDVLNRGAEALYFTSNKEFNIVTLFQNIDLKNLPIYINISFLSETFYKSLISFSEKNNATFYISLDIIGNLAKTGNWFKSQKEDHAKLDAILLHTSKPEGLLSIDTSLYQNAGANCVQQLAYSLAHANEYLNYINNNEALRNSFKESIIYFHIATSSNYFFEIAKIRALRLLYASLATEYGFNPKCHIVSKPSKRNKSIYDYNVNMLRTTTECMSSVLGGADTICNLSYDAIYHKSNEFGERISRNQLLILKNESYFDTNKNPSKGSYFIETITKQLSEKALILFKEIESNGGLITQLFEGTIQRKIKESAKRENELFEKGEISLVGSNKHPNENDLMKNELELFPFIKSNPRKTLIEPILEKRLSEKLEKERLEKENTL